MPLLALLNFIESKKLNSIFKFSSFIKVCSKLILQIHILRYKI
jgi:hypothetical protein